MMTTEKLTILYDALREGKVEISLNSPRSSGKFKNILDLVIDRYLMVTPTPSSYNERFKLTAKGRKYIKAYDSEMREGAYGLPKHLTG
jgi:predicted transcriptional regulator